VIDLKRLRELGTPWSIRRGLTVNGQVTTLVIPRDSTRVTSGITGHQRAHIGERVVILGYSYEFVAANGNGFTLAQRDYTLSPGGGTDLTILDPRATTAVTRIAHAVTECFIPLHGGSASPSLTDGADLILTLTATAPTTGMLHIWGVTIPSNEFLLTNGYRGSPYDANANPPN
jgi:hypothetical protein